MLSRTRRYFITGVLVILPLYISVSVLFIIFRFIDGILGNVINIYIKKEFGIYIPGLGIVLFCAIIFLVGFISIHFFGKSLQRTFDKVGNRFPLLRNIYPSVKRALEFFLTENELSFKKTVLVEYPSKGLWSVGFITNESSTEVKAKAGVDMLNIYIPFAPNPLSGFFVLMPRKDVTVLEMSVTDAMKLIVSAGIINPVSLTKEQKPV